MNILFVTTQYPSNIEPTKGVFNYHLARALAEKHKVTVITPVAWPFELQAHIKRRRTIPSQRYEVKDGIRVYYPRYYYPPGICRTWYGSFYWHSIRRLVRRVLEEDATEVILSFWAHPDGEAANRAARERGIASALVVGGSDVLVLTRDPRRRPRVLNALRSADAVVAVSANLAKSIGEMGIPADKIQLWTRGIDCSVFSPGDRAAARERVGIPSAGRVVIWVGRMVPVKALDVLLEACAILERRRVDFHLYLVGDGPLRSSLERTSGLLGLNQMATFVGTVLHHELPDWYRAANLTVLPSRSEGLPNVLRESLACGTPFVASRVGGIPDIAEVPAHRLVSPDDPGALADAIAVTLGEQTKPDRAKLEPKTWSESADALIEILRPINAKRFA